MKELVSLQDWDVCLAESEAKAVFVLKHSTRCPISSGAYGRVAAYEEQPAEAGPLFHLVKVIESRPVSNAITSDLGLEHASPQLILVKNRQAVWFASHYDIQPERIADAVARFVGKP